MDLKGLLEKAKAAAVSAADKANEAAAAVTEQAKLIAATPPEPPVDVALPAAARANDPGTPAPEQAIVVAQQGKSLAALTNEKFSELKTMGSEKVQQLVTSFQQALPAIKMAGYELTEFEIELGVTPKLIPHFRHAGRSAEDIDAAREALRENKIGALVLSGLLRAGEVHKQIKVAGFCFTHIELELGLIPSVRLQYKNDAVAPS